MNTKTTIKYITLKEMKEASEKYNRPVYKRYTRNGVPIYFFTVDDKPRSRTQFKLNESEVYNAFSLTVTKVFNK